VILIDTTPLVALCDERDQHHGRALRDLNRLSAKGGFVTCAAVLTESCYHLSSGYGRRRMADVFADLSIAPVAEESKADVWAEVLSGFFVTPSTRRIWPMECWRYCRDAIGG
jgi:predicted nucleic acid-binding protein